MYRVDRIDRDRAAIGCARLLTMAAVLTWATPTTNAAENSSSADEVSQVRAAGEMYLDALRRHDQQRMLAMWTPGGTYRDATGETFAARQLIEQHDGNAASAEDFAEGVSPDASIRLVSPGVAIEEGTYSPAGSSARGGYTAVWVKTGGKWLLDSVSEYTTPSDDSASPLDELSWTIGTWLGELDDFTIVCTGTWGEGRKFILRRFTIEQNGSRLLSATQRIGWDPRKLTIRSWTFQSDGSILEGRWIPDGDSWIVKTRGTLPDGNPVSAVKFWIREGEDRCALKTQHFSSADGEARDALVEFRRVASSAK